MSIVVFLSTIARPYFDANFRGIIKFEPYSSLNKQSSNLICDIPLHSSEIITMPIVTKSLQVCKSNFPQQQPKILWLFRHMVLVAEHDHFPILIGAHFGVQIKNIVVYVGWMVCGELLITFLMR